MRHFNKNLIFSVLFFTFTACASFSSNSSCLDEKISLGRNDFKVNASFYKTADSTAKSIIIFPPTGGSNAIDRSYAEQFCKAGFAVAIINGWTNDQETKSDLEIHQHFYSGAQKAIEIVLSEIKTPFIGLLGTSVGALHAAISANSIAKLDAVFLIAGGAPIAEVIVTSDQQAMIDLKALRKTRYGFANDAENIKAIDHVFTLEPQKLGTTFTKKDIGMAIAKKDHTVRTETQNQLQEFFKPSLVITLNNDHFWAIVKTWLFHSDEVLKFYEASASKKADLAH